jgi:hypothetical protein
MQIVASYRVKPDGEVGVVAQPWDRDSIGHWTRFTEETLRVRSSLGICSAALLGYQLRHAHAGAGRSLRLFGEQPDGRKTGRRRKRLSCSRTRLLFQRATQTYLWALPLINTSGT